MGVKKRARRQSPEELAANLKRMFGLKPGADWTK